MSDGFAPNFDEAGHGVCGYWFLLYMLNCLPNIILFQLIYHPWCPDLIVLEVEGYEVFSGVGGGGGHIGFEGLQRRGVSDEGYRNGGCVQRSGDVALVRTEVGGGCWVDAMRAERW